MAVDGNWNLTMTTPMGERKATLSLASSGGTLTGTQGAEGNSTEIFDGTVNGDDVAWKVSITNPMPLTLEFTGKVAGDGISGEMGIGPMGSFPFTGTRHKRDLLEPDLHRQIMSIQRLRSLRNAALVHGQPTPPRRHPAHRRASRRCRSA